MLQYPSNFKLLSACSLLYIYHPLFCSTALVKNSRTEKNDLAKFYITFDFKFACVVSLMSIQTLVFIYKERDNEKPPATNSSGTV